MCVEMKKKSDVIPLGKHKLFTSILKKIQNLILSCSIFYFFPQKRLKKLKKTVYEEPEELKRAPHSFVIHRGQIGKSLLQLVKDFRKVMEPFTASSLQVIVLVNRHSLNVH